MNRIIGIENELMLCGEGVDKNHKYGSIVDEIAELTGKPFYGFAWHHGSGFMLWNGTVTYSDGGAAEITSAAAEIKPGCVTECINSLFSARNMLFEGIEKYNKQNETSISLGAYSGHYNVSIDDEKYDELFSLIKKSIGLAYMLFVEKKDSKGIMVRKKTDRIEICGEYLPSYNQNIAAMALILGTVTAMEERKIEPPFELKCRKQKEGGDDVLWPPNYAPAFLKKGRDATVTAILKNKKTQRMKAQKALEEYFAFFRDDIQKIAPNEIKTVEDYVKGNLQLDIDRNGTPENYNPAGKTKDVDMDPKGIAKYFARAVREKEKVKDYDLKTTRIDWDDISFYLKKQLDNSFSYPIKVARCMLSRFYSDVDELKHSNDQKRIDKFLKNVQNSFYSGEPQIGYPGDE